MLNNLIKWERENGYKASYVAEKLGLTQGQYSKIKHGRMRPPVSMAEKLQSEFNVENPFDLLK